jgi:hypothetical protein
MDDVRTGVRLVDVLYMYVLKYPARSGNVISAFSSRGKVRLETAKNGQFPSHLWVGASDAENAADFSFGSIAGRDFGDILAYL